MLFDTVWQGCDPTVFQHGCYVINLCLRGFPPLACAYAFLQMLLMSCVLRRVGATTPQQKLIVPAVCTTFEKLAGLELRLKADRENLL